MYALTSGEVTAIRDALKAAQDELCHVEEETDHVVTTGALELCDEALEIVEGLLEYELLHKR